MLGKGETREERRERREQPEHLQHHRQIALRSTRSTQEHLGAHSAHTTYYIPHRALRSTQRCDDELLKKTSTCTNRRATHQDNGSTVKHTDHTTHHT